MRGRANGAIARIALAALWLAVTAGVAFYVARQAVPEDHSAIDSVAAPPIAGRQRETTMLEQHIIQPVVSGDGSVVADGDQFNLEAPVSPATLAYQLLQPPVSVKALITGGPAGFDCGWVGLGQGPDGGVTMRCRVPANVKVVPGLTGTMVLAMSEPVKKNALPVTAVVGNAGQGQVIAVDADGTTAVREIGLGVSDNFWIEVTSGLEPGETVFAAPVQADFAVAPS